MAQRRAGGGAYLKAMLGVLGIAAIGAGLIWGGQWYVGAEHQSLSYASTTGQIMFVGTESELTTDRERRFRPLVRYDYTVEGKVYHGKVIAFDMNSYERSSEADARATLRWSVGNQVTVYYDPTAPDQAVLARGDPIVGAQAGGWWPPHPATAIGLLLVAIAVIGVIRLIILGPPEGQP